MKKTIIVLAVSFSLMTTIAFFVYPYLRYPIPKSLEGIYVRFSEHEYGREWDTLTLSKIPSSVPAYQVLRGWRYERVLAGQAQPAEYKKQVTKISTADTSNWLVEEETGIGYAYNEELKELMAGKTIYKRIK